MLLRICLSLFALSCVLVFLDIITARPLWSLGCAIIAALMFFIYSVALSKNPWG